ncbi:MAG: excinuclease ABC subunit UvrA [Gemmatimonadaceae bacterium]|nr:excinuclease ABC subunit UvrA [Gemmatimonadaceae bacterium]
MADTIRVRGAREHNLRNVDVDIPRDALVVFSGVSGSGKSSLAFGTIFAESQRRYLESVAPYARRLFDQVGVPDVDSIDGLPPAVALQQQRGSPSVRSSVGTVSTISSLLRMLYSRVGTYPAGAAMLYAEDFSPNTPQGACPTCHGLGAVFDVTEDMMVPDPTLTIRERAVAAWPTAWQGQNLRDILVTLGHDVDLPWKSLPKRTRTWILFTDEQPTVPVYAGFTATEVTKAIRRKAEPSYMGTFIGARKYVLDTFANTQSALMKKRVSRFMRGTACALCDGKRLKRASLDVTVAGMDIGEISRMPLGQLASTLSASLTEWPHQAEEKRIAGTRLIGDIVARISTLTSLGLGYLALDRSTTTLSPGELQRVRLATQILSNLFGVVYVLDEPSAGLHPADNAALIQSMMRLRDSGNSVFVVEHDLDIMRHADWIVDVGPGGGTAGGHILHSGSPALLEQVTSSITGAYLFGRTGASSGVRRIPTAWLQLTGVTRNTVRGLDVRIPLAALTMVTGISGSGKSSLVSQALVDLIESHLGGERSDAAIDEDADLQPMQRTIGAITDGAEHVRRLVRVDQKPIGRTPRSNLATYTGLFDHVRALFAATPAARRRHWTASRFSFNLAPGRCATCEGEGYVSVELLFMPMVYAPCGTCHGARYNDATLSVLWNGRSIADVLRLTVAEAETFFEAQPNIVRPLTLLRSIGLGYLRLGQPATELSGGEAQRIKLATELQRSQRRDTIYILDEPSTGLHPADVDLLMTQLQALVDAGNTVVVVEHDMRIVAQSDWVIDMGPGAGASGGCIVAQGTPADVARSPDSVTAPWLRPWIA